MKYIMLLLMSISTSAFAGSNAAGAIGTNPTAPGGIVGSNGGTSSFGVTVTDPDVIQKVPGRPKTVGGNKTKTTTQVLSNTYGTITGAVTNIQSTPTRANSGNKDSTVLGAESAFGSITSHRVEDFQNTVIRTKIADPSQQLCPQGYQYVGGVCVVPTPQCPGSPIAKVWNTGTKTCDCPSNAPNWNGITCIAACTGGQVFDGYGCSTPGCSATNQQQTVACGTGFTGNKTQQRDYTCTNATTGVWGNWYDINTSSCVSTGPGPTPPQNPSFVDPSPAGCSKLEYYYDLTTMIGMSAPCSAFDNSCHATKSDVFYCPSGIASNEIYGGTDSQGRAWFAMQEPYLIGLPGSYAFGKSCSNLTTGCIYTVSTYLGTCATLACSSYSTNRTSY